MAPRTNKFFPLAQEDDSKFTMVQGLKRPNNHPSKQNDCNIDSEDRPSNAPEVDLQVEGYSEPDYLPSKEQIEAACKEIQQEWSPEERLRRHAGCSYKSLTPHIVDKPVHKYPKHPLRYHE